MTITRYPHGVSSFGMPVLGSGGHMTTGTVFFVDSATGSNGYDGKSPDSPVADIDTAIGLCTANKGDIIFVMPNHAETIGSAAAINADVEGIKIIGLGVGDNRPKITFSGSAASAATIAIGADSVYMENLVFDLASDTGNGVIQAIDVNDNHFTMYNCEFEGGGASAQAVSCIVLDANAADAKIIGNRFISTTAGGSNAIDLAGDVTGVDIIDNHFAGDWGEAVIWSTASGISELRILRNYMRNDNAGEPAISIGTSDEENEGFIAWNVYDLADSASLNEQDTLHGQVVCAENFGSRPLGGNVTAKRTPYTSYAS